MQKIHPLFRNVFCLLTAGLVAPSGGKAQPADSVRLSLEEAVSRALAEGEEMKMATAQIDFAESQIANARADALPQLQLNLGYTRQIESIFRGSGFGGNGTSFPVFEPDTTAALDRRVRDIENALPAAGLASLLNQFSDTPFGRLNTWNAGITFNQTLFDGSRLWTAPRAASRVRDATEAQYEEERAGVTLSVKKAYFAALLTEQTVHIARMSLEQAERQVAQVQRQHREGTTSDFELLQAEVQRDNQIPEVASAEERHALALLELKRLINMEAATPLKLTSSMQDPAGQPADVPPLTALLERSRDRASIVSALRETEARQMAVNVARSDFWPKVSFFSNYNRQAFPAGLFPKGGDWRTDWSVGFTLNMNLFDGLRTRALVSEARANLALAREQHAQVQETIALGVEQAYRNLHRVRAQITARQRTVEQAVRALRLAEIRYEEGISTQLEVSDTRLQLQRARLNYVQALHDYNVALVELERAANVHLMKP